MHIRHAVATISSTFNIVSIPLYFNLDQDMILQTTLYEKFSTLTKSLLDFKDNTLQYQVNLERKELPNYQKQNSSLFISCVPQCGVHVS